MTVPCDITFKFGNNLPAGVTPDAVITDELQRRIGCLLTGKFITDAEGRCVIDIEKDLPPGFEPRGDSICVGVDLGPISIGFCKEINK